MKSKPPITFDADKPTITFDAEGKPTIWWYILALPCICVLASGHFILCLGLMVFFRTEKRRREIYEYYAPWGWKGLVGDDKDDDYQSS